MITQNDIRPFSVIFIVEEVIISSRSKFEELKLRILFILRCIKFEDETSISLFPL